MPMISNHAPMREISLVVFLTLRSRSLVRQMLGDEPGLLLVQPDEFADEKIVGAVVALLRPVLVAQQMELAERRAEDLPVILVRVRLSSMSLALRMFSKSATLID
jgi:hypothetical protein